MSSQCEKDSPKVSTRRLKKVLVIRQIKNRQDLGHWCKFEQQSEIFSVGKSEVEQLRAWKTGPCPPSGKTLFQSKKPGHAVRSPNYSSRLSKTQPNRPKEMSKVCHSTARSSVAWECFMVFRANHFLLGTHPLDKTITRPSTGGGGGGVGDDDWEGGGRTTRENLTWNHWEGSPLGPIISVEVEK
ncbi:hypothetical protein RUM44_009154 [Polyplax serrata]|uniref:Uncharacterized protein n=1 Tax=Polyplax serrata TaxID=468196 RepID=A0ABR1ATF1_POLSC